MSHYARTFAVLAALVVLQAGHAEGQLRSPVHRGGWIISGGASIGRTHNDDFDGDVTHIGVQPTGLVFVTNRFAIGASLPLSYTGFSNPSGHAYAYGIGPAARYYLATDTARWLPFIGASVEPQWQKEHRTVTILTAPSGTPTVETIDAENRVLTVDGSLGLTRLLVEHVGLTGELYYMHQEFSSDFGSERKLRSYDVGARFGLTVFVH